jgi:hypothetical protein
VGSGTITRKTATVQRGGMCCLGFLQTSPFQALNNSVKLRSILRRGPGRPILQPLDFSWRTFQKLIVAQFQQECLQMVRLFHTWNVYLETPILSRQRHRHMDHFDFISAETNVVSGLGFWIHGLMVSRIFPIQVGFHVPSAGHSWTC